MRRRIETTDGRYVQLADGEWWDTTGTEIVRDTVVDEHMKRNNVGVVAVEVDDDEEHGEAGRSHLH